MGQCGRSSGCGFALLHFVHPLAGVADRGSLEHERLHDPGWRSVHKLDEVCAFAAVMPHAGTLQVDPQLLRPDRCRLLVFEVPQRVIHDDEVSLLPQLDGSRRLLLKELCVFNRVRGG